MRRTGQGARVDAITWWTEFVAAELEGCAEVVRTIADLDPDPMPNATGARAVVTITPHRPDALPLTVRAGGGDVPRLAFGGVAETKCFGIAAAGDRAGLDPSNQLGVMVAAVVSDGATLVRRGRRSILLLGRPPAAGESPVQRWEPYGEQKALTLFRRSPDYETLPLDAFAVRASPARRGGLTRPAGD